jgi:hypothetical protein
VLHDAWVFPGDPVGEGVEEHDNADTQQAQPQAARILAVGIVGAGDDVVHVPGEACDDYHADVCCLS